MKIYPSSDEIKNALLTTNVDLYLPAVKEWKKRYYNKKWGAMNELRKTLSLVCLIQEISLISSNPNIKYVFGDEYHYNTAKNEIMVSLNPSILSTLHEVGHALWGDSELDACRFSIAIFKEIFPKEYSRLVWDGHMLKNK